MADDTTTDPMLGALVELLKATANPDAQRAQTLLLQRMALQGDVTPSRLPAPRNITELGGYINLLGTLGEPEMRAQMLASVLGVAGPTPPLGWLSAQPPLSMVPLANDRPAGPAQPQMPLSFSVRSDFLPAVQAALAALHDRGCALPLFAPTPSLPPGAPGVTPPADVLYYLGRTLDLVPGAALVDPATDPIVLAQTDAAAPLQVLARVLAPGAIAVTPADWLAQKCDAAACAPVVLAAAQLVPVAPLFAAAGFYPAAPVAPPATSAASAWSQLTNITGLVTGRTRLGDELSLLYATSAITGSAFAGALSWLWNGSTFAPA